MMLDSADRRPAGGAELSRPRSRFQEARGPRQGGRRREGGAALHPQVPFLGVHQRAGRRRTSASPSATPATSSRRATAPPRPRTSRTSPTPSPRRARCCGSTSRRSPRTRPIPSRRSASSISCSSPRSPPPRASSPATPTPTRRRRPLMPKEITGNPLIYPPPDVRARFYTITAGTAEQVRERTRLWTTDQDGPIDVSGSTIVRIEGVTKRFGAITRRRRRRSRHRARRAVRPAGRLGLRQDHPAAHAGRASRRPTPAASLIDGQDMTGVPPHRRPVNMMFQSYALFPHMNVADNVGYGLRREGLPKAEIATRVAEALEQVRLADYAARTAGAALGRPAPARGARPRAGQAAQAAAARRAAGRARPQAARGHALRAGAPAGGARPHLRHGDPRPGRGDVAGEPAGRHEAGRIVQVGTPHEVYERPAALRRRLHRRRQHLARRRRLAGAAAGEDPPVGVARPGAGDAVAGKIVDAAYEGDRSLYRVRLARRRAWSTRLLHASADGAAGFRRGQDGCGRASDAADAAPVLDAMKPRQAGAERDRPGPPAPGWRFRPRPLRPGAGCRFCLTALGVPPFAPRLDPALARRSAASSPP